jgi:hypothetical protein
MGQLDSTAVQPYLDWPGAQRADLRQRGERGTHGHDGRRARELERGRGRASDAQDGRNDLMETRHLRQRTLGLLEGFLRAGLSVTRGCGGGRGGCLGRAGCRRQLVF